LAIRNTSQRKDRIINTGPRKQRVTLDEAAKGLGAEIVGVRNTTDPVAAAQGAQLLFRGSSYFKIDFAAFELTKRIAEVIDSSALGSDSIKGKFQGLIAA
jgi:hypothetical protein